MNRTEYLLTCLGEECNEIAQRVSKALRFGLDEIQPGQPLTNTERIVGEIVDFLGVLGMLEEASIIAMPVGESLASRLRLKEEKVREFMAYARDCGALLGEEVPDA